MNTNRGTGHRRKIVVADFFDRAADLRAAFDAAVDPDAVTPKHFCWNYWNVPGQYTYLRTPARTFFDGELFAAFERRLCDWGKATIGCNLANSYWLSFYVDGCRQELHADVAHGPWAWVYSITKWDTRGFRGGETQLARDETLDYWRRGDAFLRGAELGADRGRLFEEIDPHFGQLVLFDGRIPHGVREVRGTDDPRDSRIVLHGWFEPPAVQVDGALTKSDALGPLQAAFAALGERLATFDDADGALILRLSVAPSGHVEHLDVLTDTMETSGDDRAARDALVDTTLGLFGEIRFPMCRAPSVVVVPVSARR
jgi:hypothetical protein